jgi:hypothetical protein
MLVLFRLAVTILARLLVDLSFIVILLMMMLLPKLGLCFVHLFEHFLKVICTALLLGVFIILMELSQEGMGSKELM